MILSPEKFTEQARQVLSDSQVIVRRYKHSQWDVEHVLLALLELESGLPADILGKLGIPIEPVRDRMREALEKFPKMASETNQIYATPRAAQMLENARLEAEHMKDEFIGTEHLLIAASMERDGEARNVLKEAGIDQENVYRALDAGAGQPQDRRSQGGEQVPLPGEV